MQWSECLYAKKNAFLNKQVLFWIFFNCVQIILQFIQVSRLWLTGVCKKVAAKKEVRHNLYLLPRFVTNMTGPGKFVPIIWHFLQIFEWSYNFLAQVASWFFVKIIYIYDIARIVKLPCRLYWTKGIHCVKHSKLSVLHKLSALSALSEFYALWALSALSVFFSLSALSCKWKLV